MIKKKLLLGFGISAVTALALSGCAAATTPAETNDAANEPAAECVPAHEFDTLKDGVITAAGMNEMPGFLGQSASGPFQGLNFELMTMFAEENCKTLEWQPGTGPQVALAISEAKVDSMVGIVIVNAQREELFYTTDQELFFETAGIASNKDDAFTSVEDLQGQKVGAVQGSNYVPLLTEAIGEGNVQLYQGSDAAYKDLAAGRIDAVVTPSSPQGYYISQQGDDTVVSNIIEADEAYPELTRQYKVTWPGIKTNTAYGEALNQFFIDIHEDGRLAEVLEKYGVTDEFYINGRDS